MSTPPEDPRQRFARTGPTPANQAGNPVVNPTDPADLTATLPPADPASTLHLPQSAATEGETRFGPGVPGAPGATGDRATAIWQGTITPNGPSGAPIRRRRRRPSALWPFWAVVALVVVVVVIIRSWMGSEPPLHVTGATVGSPAVDRCAKTVVITGILNTNGSSGTVDYRWKRSDGTASGILHQQVDGDVRSHEVVLRWSFDGPGTMKATATLEVLSPDPTTASTTFTYDCS